MKKFLRFEYLVFLLMSIFINFGVSYATTISFIAENLADTTAGEDLWQYQYKVSDHNFNEYEGFTIWFDYGLYQKLNAVSNSSEWDVLTTEPEVILGSPDDGNYDAMALVGGTDISEKFVVSFVWLGDSSGPGSQYFDIYDDNYNIGEMGVTTSESTPVPEPASVILFALGFLMLKGIFLKDTYALPDTIKYETLGDSEKINVTDFFKVWRKS